MDLISTKAISKVSRHLDNLDDGGIEALVERMGDEQPLLFAYLFEMGGQDFDEDERSILVYYGLFIWQVFASNEADLRVISEGRLSEIEEVNRGFFEWVMEGDISLKEVYTKAREDASQTFLLEEIYEALNQEEIQENDTQVFMFLYLKILIDCWSFSLN